MIRAGHLFRAYAASPITGAERDAQGRVWCQLFPLGEWSRKDFPGGKMQLTPELMASFIASWKAAGSPPLPVDYEHKEDGPASGWIEDLRVSATGELQGAIKWTDEAAEDIKADRRRYLSPTWAMQHTNRRTGEKGGPWLYGAALTNSPFFDSMPRVAASAVSPTTHQPNEAPRGEEQHMNEEQLKVLRASLGLAADATAEQINAAVKALKDGHEKLTASAVTTEKLTAAVKAAVEPLEAKLKAAQAETEKLQASLVERDVEALITTAKLAGKPVEPMREFIATAAKRSMDEAKKLVDALPVVMSTKEKGLTASTPEDTADAAKKFEALVDEKMKAGAKYAEAYRLVGAENPELAKQAFPTTINQGA